MKKMFTVLLAVAVLLCCCIGCGNKTPEVSDPIVSSDPDVSTGTTVSTDTTEDDGNTTLGDSDNTDNVTDTTDEVEDTTTEADQTTDTTTGADTTIADKTTTQGTKTTASTGTTTIKTNKTTTKTTTAKTNKTTGKTTTAKTTTAKTTTTKGSTTKTTTTITTKRTTTTTTVTTTTRYRPGITTTTKGDSGVTVTTQNGAGKGYEFDPGDEWTLYWNDEFDGNAVDTSKWNVEEGSTGFYNKKASNVSVQNGQLVLSAKRENPYTNHKTDFSTGYVNSGGKFSFQYGRLEFRARLTYGKGVWSALWTLGDSYLSASSDETGWPICGEIDVMEMVGGGGEADKYISSGNKLHTAGIHWGANRDVHQSINAVRHSVSDGILADAYHIYAIEWDEECIKFFFDDQMLSKISLNDESMLDSFHQPHWIIINIAMYNYEPEIADETTPLPQFMYVDYVRVYKKK